MSYEKLNFIIAIMREIVEYAHLTFSQKFVLIQLLAMKLTSFDGIILLLLQHASDGFYIVFEAKKTFLPSKYCNDTSEVLQNISRNLTFQFTILHITNCNPVLNRGSVKWI